MLKFAFLTSALALAGVPAAAQAPQVQPVAASSSSSPDTNKIVCKKEDTIGSRLGAKKVCLTTKEWADLAKQSREEVERIQQNAGTRPGS